jgi:hypothetical protein
MMADADVIFNGRLVRVFPGFFWQCKDAHTRHATTAYEYIPYHAQRPENTPQIPFVSQEMSPMCYHEHATTAGSIQWMVMSSRVPVRSGWLPSHAATRSARSARSAMRTVSSEMLLEKSHMAGTRVSQVSGVEARVRDCAPEKTVLSGHMSLADVIAKLYIDCDLSLVGYAGHEIRLTRYHCPTVLLELKNAGEEGRSYAGVLRCVKPQVIGNGIVLRKCPSELIEVRKDINKALKQIGAPVKVRCIRGKGMKLVMVNRAGAK